ncbi:MAG: hypothetical protein ACI9F9_002820 [Candidatus Paceibacteria bacterium]|jgi:hypothetical protein
MASFVTRFLPSIFTPGLLAVALLSPVMVTSALAQEDSPTAPDGRTGFGHKKSAREVGKIFRCPDEDQEAFLRGLYDVSSDILVLRERARRSYDKRDYFKSLSRRSLPELSDLHSAFRAKMEDPEKVILAGGEQAALFVSMWLDLRFRLRMELFAQFEIEGPELRKGLALLAGSQNGYYDLKDGETRSITRRMDLAAARLRAVRSDLEVLRERGNKNAPGSADPAWGRDLLALRGIPGDSDRRHALEALQAKSLKARMRLETVLFSARLAPQVKPEVDRRQAVLDQSALHLENAQAYLMIPPFDQNPAKAMLELSRSKRHRFALSESLRGLDLDPLSEELTYITGIAAAELQDPRETRGWFDRYLAMRGIRSDVQATMKGRDLTPEEKRCLEEVMRAFVGPGSGFGPR